MAAGATYGPHNRHYTVTDGRGMSPGEWNDALEAGQTVDSGYGPLHICDDYVGVHTADPFVGLRSDLTGGLK